MEKDQKVFAAIIIAGAALLIAVGIGGYNSYKNNQKNLPADAAIISGYPELTSEVIEKMGGRTVVDGLIVKFEAAKTNLSDAIKKYEDGGKKDEDKPSMALFAETAKYAQYLKKYDTAVAILEDTFTYYDKSDIALLNMAHVYEETKDYQKAVDTYLRFQAMYPAEIIDRYYANLIQDYIALGDKAKAVEYYAQYTKAGFKSEEIAQYISKM